MIYNLEIVMRKNKINGEPFYAILKLLNVKDEKLAYKVLNYIMDADYAKLENLADKIIKVKTNKFPCKEIPISMDALYNTENIMKENGVDKVIFIDVLKLLGITDRKIEFELLNYILTTNQTVIDKVAEELLRVKKK